MKKFKAQVRYSSSEASVYDEEGNLIKAHKPRRKIIETKMWVSQPNKTIKNSQLGRQRPDTLLIFRYDEDGNLVDCAAPNASVLSQMAKKIADTNDDEIIIGKDGEIINKSEIQRQKTQSRLSRKNTERK